MRNKNGSASEGMTWLVVAFTIVFIMIIFYLLAFVSVLKQKTLSSEVVFSGYNDVNSIRTLQTFYAYKSFDYIFYLDNKEGLKNLFFEFVKNYYSNDLSCYLLIYDNDFEGNSKMGVVISNPTPLYTTSHNPDLNSIVSIPPFIYLPVKVGLSPSYKKFGISIGGCNEK